MNVINFNQFCVNNRIPFPGYTLIIEENNSNIGDNRYITGYKCEIKWDERYLFINDHFLVDPDLAIQATLEILSEFLETPANTLEFFSCVRSK